MKVEWSVFKNFVNSRGLYIQYIDIGSHYWLKVFDDKFELECNIDKNPSDTTDLDDFVNNYMPNANKPLGQVDTDNAHIVRVKAAKRGWSFWAVAVEFTTSTLSGSLYAKDVSETDIPWISCKIYNAQDQEITTAGVLNANLNTCVKTVIDFEPTFDYEIIGGALRINSNPVSDVRLWIIGAPDIEAPLGSKEFASGINLKFLAPDSSFEVDGRVTKFLTYNPATHQGKMRIVLKHGAGVQVNMQIVMHIYRA